MTLSQRDLEAIRAIVREEIRNALGAPAQSTPRDDGDDHDDPHGYIAELARAHVAQMRGMPGADEQCTRAEARYRLYHDGDWVVRARRWLRKDAAEPVSEAEMESYMRSWKATRKLADEKSRATRAAKRAAKKPTE